MDLNVSQSFQDAWEKVGGWIEHLIELIPNLIAALVIVAAFWVLALLVRRGVRGVMDRVTDHGPVKSLVVTLAGFAVLAAGIFLALGTLQLDGMVTTLLAGVGVVGLALGFAFQDIAENFIAGVLMGVRQPFTDGDLIETGDYFGIVEDVNLRATVLRSLTGQIVRIPNAEVFGSPIVNYSVTGSRRVDVSCGVSYGDDLAEAERVAREALAGVEGRDVTRDPEVFWEEFGGSSINFVGRFWIPFRAGNAEYLAARSRAVVAIKRAFDSAGVGIPFPITTLDFGDVGGRRLKDELKLVQGSGTTAD